MTRPFIAWASLGVALALTYSWMAEHLWVLSFLPVFAWAMWGIAILVPALWRLKDAAQRQAAVRAAGGVVLAALLFVPIAYAGGWGVEKIRFAGNREAYDRISSRLESELAEGHTSRFRDAQGVQYIFDEGPPRRVAFPWPGGIIDNWCGIVFDPSADVMKVNDLPLWTPTWRNHPMTRLFGGEMTSCRRMQEPYFMCCFT